MAKDRTRIVTLLTDFGIQDAYVAAMKGVMLSIDARLRFVDISHQIAPQDVLGAAFVLESAWRFFPAGTVHLVVVDPGVGGERRAIAAESEGHCFVAPDNGVLGLALAEASEVEAVELVSKAFWRMPKASATFHGRDIFAPAAAYLAQGTSLESLGEPASQLLPAAWPQPQLASKELCVGEVVYVDHFGNLITNIPEGKISQPGSARISCGGQRLGAIRLNYASVQVGELLALVGSHGMLEIAVRNGSASRALGVGRGARVSVDW